MFARRLIIDTALCGKWSLHYSERLKALKFSTLYKMKSFSVWIRYLVKDFKIWTFKFCAKYLNHTLKDMWFVEKCNFKSSGILKAHKCFQNAPEFTYAYVPLQRKMTTHYSDVIMGGDGVSIHKLHDYFTQPFIQARIKQNIKAPRSWSLCGAFAGDRRIPRTNSQ